MNKINQLKRDVCKANKYLEIWNLTVLTSGNVSARCGNKIIIKPSGVDFQSLTSEKMCVVDINGKNLTPKLNPSSDVYTHLEIYKNRPEICGIVHTHSTFASVFSTQKKLPCILTSMADEFGEDIKVTSYAQVGDNNIGKEITKFKKIKAILIRNHGVFAMSEKTALDAVKIAFRLEDIAKTTYYILQMPKYTKLNNKQIKIAQKRYLKYYGQKKN